ncbi:hypothetical protein CPC735_036490 [Coccidioides posadasii C735 delta SOWgp]|uniref:Sld7 C-terminal domain-containing protein n=1 Tax=Coccidioides posadasii (strain C735) TaxID=222929 RepID=C5P240_COCP7|nr:hypothetical protein CPC735_036490 [Coccidioides posadasii C735 delta SOWgp]EER28943.1 hypothetical protein CPC735_036490 [Coccidioides posadasii C735 delta SOWgp]|eukprot:XP_003071088.1 hypothetical protein CPC735_036490 [Coccidioides posadasii C735 delta SOWgp]
MEVWSGVITADFLTLDGTLVIQISWIKLILYLGVRLLNPLSSNQCDISKAKLILRSLVDPTLVPLFAITGPALEVHISNTATRDWIRSRLLHNVHLDSEDHPDEEFCTTKQCPVGILLAVEHLDSNAHARKISDLLIYGILSSSESDTQQRYDSSSPTRELRVYAAPICSTLVVKALSLPSPPLTPSEGNHADGAEIPEYAEFLSDPLAPSPKRKRVDTLFEAADEYHKKVRRKGMIAVSEYIEKSREASPKLQFPYPRAKREPQNDTSILYGSQSNPGKQTLCGAGTRDSSLPRQFSGVSRPRSMSIASRKSTPSASVTTKECSQISAGDSSMENILSTNKGLLTRTILTCMRMYGYHRNASASRAKFELNRDSTDSTALNNSTTELLQPAADAEEEDEFKTMYHATYRASTFALRKFLNIKSPASGAKLHSSISSRNGPEGNTPSVPVLDRAKATDVVDSVLKLFCEEPG